MRRLLALIALVACAAGLAVVLGVVDPAAGGDGPARGEAEPPRRAPDADAEPARRPAGRTRPDARRLRTARCPAGVPDCRAVRGRIVLVEAVDPDGDGDLHVVIADGSVTAPGFTAVDVRPGLRPRRDPRVGDLASAAGSVQTGSFGQSQIHASAFYTRRAG